MGRTPGKWIKNLLLGNKSSKKSASKNLKRSKSEEFDDSAPVISALLVASVKDSEIRAAAEVSNDSVTVLSGKEDGQTVVVSSSGSEDVQKREEAAAVKAQSAYRGYVARRAYRTLKGIIRLQAVIRGHLVRRQAVSTLLCVQGIVKLQALIRGQHVRHSDIGVEVQKVYQGDTDYSGAIASSQVKRLPKHAFARKLLESLPTASLLSLQYVPEDPNSSEVWLDRWTRSFFWESVVQLKKKPDQKSRGKYKKIPTIDTEPAKPKRTVRRLSSDNGPNRVTPDVEKPKWIMRKVANHPVNSIQEHQQNGVEKPKSNVKRVSDPKEVSGSKKKVSDPKEEISGPKKNVSDSKEKVSGSKKKVSDQSEVGKEIPNHSTEAVITPAAHNEAEQLTSESSPKMQHVEVSVSKYSDPECITPTNEPLQKSDYRSSGDMPSVEINGKNEVQPLTEVLTSADNFISNEDQKRGQRRASLPMKLDQRENGLPTSPRVPSYMAPTESARARLKGQGSPRFAQDVVEKNLLSRRHSLSSSTNTKLGLLSPRAQKLVQGKGVSRTDRSLSSSRDGFVSDKGIQPDWRR